MGCCTCAFESTNVRGKSFQAKDNPQRREPSIPDPKLPPINNHRDVEVVSVRYHPDPRVNVLFGKSLFQFELGDAS